MKHAVAALEGALLDAAVAKADGLDWEIGEPGTLRPGCHVPSSHPMWREPDYGDVDARDQLYLYFSTDWALGGPIIERERIDVSCVEWSRQSYLQPTKWRGSLAFSSHPAQHGPTLLIAAMRAYVASKVGEEVDM